MTMLAWYVQQAAFSVLFISLTIVWLMTGHLPAAVVSGMGLVFHLGFAVVTRQRERARTTNVPAPEEGANMVVGVVLPDGFTEFLTIPVADPVNPRIDRVVWNPETRREALIVGTPGPSPCAPTVPIGWVVLADIEVPSNATCLAPGNVRP